MPDGDRAEYRSRSRPRGIALLAGLSQIRFTKVLLLKYISPAPANRDRGNQSNQTIIAGKAGSGVSAPQETAPTSTFFFLPSFTSVIMVSMVRRRVAMEAAFSRADRATFAGSMMPAFSMSVYSPVKAL